MQTVKIALVALLAMSPAQFKTSTSLKAQSPLLTPSPLAMEIQAVAKHLQPKLSEAQSLEIAQAVEKYSLKHKLEWKLVLSILNQESSLRRDPQNCLAAKANCTGDYGIGQVRKGVWAKVFAFDGHKLLSSYDYAIGAATQILAHYRDKYAKKELNWYTRYHSGTPEYRSEYMLRINKSFAKVNSAMAPKKSFQVSMKNATLVVTAP